MFDFTKEAALDPKNFKLYRKLQIALYLGTFFLAAYLSYIIIFPNNFFTFSFLEPNSSKNTVSLVRLKNNSYPEKGKVSAKDNLIFNTSIVSDYSETKIEVILNKNSSQPKNGSAFLKRSHQAFMYEEGSPVGFKNGSLIKNSGSFYIVSGSSLRKFSDSEALKYFGYSEENFQEVEAGDLEYNAPSKDLPAGDAYPDEALFRIEDNYYILENQELKKFVSNQAFLSSYSEIQALNKDENFLQKFPASLDLEGFSDGTLVANGESAYVVSLGKINPIDSIQTFENMGYAWGDLINVGTDELSMYEKGNLFTVRKPHPDGTVFRTVENSKYYIVRNGKKLPLPSEKIALSWTRKSPVLVSEKSLGIIDRCYLKKSRFNSRSYQCQIPLDRFLGLIGLSYEYNLDFGNDVQIDSINIDYIKNANKNNLKLFLTNTLNSIKINYVRD